MTCATRSSTRLVERGVELITVKELLGHSSITVTERYTHSFKEQKRRAVELLGEKRHPRAKIVEDLFHRGDTDDGKKKEGRLNGLFSVN